MFGSNQNNQQGSPFGGGGTFGQQSSTPFASGGNTGAGGFAQGFGSPAPAPFGSSAFGAPGGTTTSGGFGATASPFGAAPAGGGGGGLFGSTAQQGMGGTSTFGAPAPTGGGLFGAPAPTTTFGSPMPAAPGGGMFGGSNTNPSTFGGVQQQPGLFGSTANTNTAFGGSTAAAPAGSGLFGNPAPTGNTGGVFGTTNTNTGFAQPSAGFGTFGSSANTAQPGAFGSTGGATTFGAPAPSASVFGSPAPAQASGGLFGSAPAAANMSGMSGGGTSATPFAPTSKQDGSNSGATLVFQSITAMPAYENKSFEELRMEDYMKGNKGQSTPTASNTPIAFGSTAPAPFSTGGGLFAGTPTTSSAAPGTGMFGSAPAPGGFGSAATGGSLFGRTTTPAAASSGLFGAPQAAPGFATGQTPATGFGAPSATFGSTANQSQGMFGAPAPVGGFVAPTATPNAFGAPLAPATPGFGGGFGAAPSGFPAQPPPTLFSNVGNTGTNPQQTLAFGNQANAFPPGQPQAQTGSQAPMQNAQGPVQHTAAPAPAGPIFPPNLNIVPPHMAEIEKQNAQLIKSLQDQVTQNRAWYPDNVGSTSTATGLPSPHARFTVAPPPYSGTRSSVTWNTARSPMSGAKLQPRGHPWTDHLRDDEKPRAKISELGRGGSAYPRSAHMTLVVKPNSLAPPRLNLSGKRIDPSARAVDSAMSPPKDSSVTSPVAGSSLTPLTASNTFTPSADADASRPQDSSPKPSPAATALYNQATAEEPIPITSPPSRVPVAVDVVPTLTKAGYECEPSTSDLATLSEADLAAVSNFKVRRPGFGEVFWEGAVDVRGIDLDEAVEIQHSSISVYPDEKFSESKPAVGTKLNRPALLTFEEMYPRGGARADADEMHGYEAKLRGFAQRSGAEFISYEPVTGQWKIRTFHFSRYGVFDDSEDDEPMPSARQVKFASGSTPTQKQGRIVRDQTPYAKPSNVGFEEGEVEHYMTKDVQMSDNDVVDTVKNNVEKTYNDVFGIAQRVRKVTEAERVRGLSSEIVVEEDVGESMVDSQLIVKPSKDLILEAKQLGSFTGRLCPNRSSINYGLNHGQSMRAHWSPTGAVFVPDVTASCQVMQPAFGDTIANLPAVLLRLYSISERDSTNEEDCPLFQLPLSVQNGGDESSHKTLLEFLFFLGSSNFGNEEVQNAFLLLAALLETSESSTDIVPVAEGEKPSYTFDERRNLALLSWLTSVNASATDRKISAALVKNDLPAAIFAAISSGDVEKAATIAMDRGAIDLAVTLSTGREGVFYLSRMVSRLSTSGQAVPQELVRSLRALCGQSSLEESLYRTGSDLSWQQRLALLLLQYPSLPLSSLLAKYDDGVENGTSPFASPQYDVKSIQVESLQFRILRAMAKPQSISISDVVNTDGFSNNTHDLSHSFLLAAALSASGFASWGDPFELERLTSGMEAQLLAQDCWGLAVVVCLYSFGSSSKEVRFAKLQRARKHVLQFFSGDDQSVPTLDFIPLGWKAEAMAYKTDDVFSFIEHLNKDKAFQEEASSTMEKQLLPGLFFNDELASIAKYSNTTTTSVTEAVIRLDTLMSQVYSAGSVPGSVESILEVCAALEDVFKGALAETIELSPVSASSLIDYNHVLQENIHRIGVLRFLASSTGISGSK